MLKHVSIYLVPGLAVLNFFAGLPTLFQKSVWIFLIISMTSWIIFSGKHDFLDHSLIFSFFNFIIFLVSRAPDIPKSPSSDWAAAPQGVSHRLLIRHQLRQDSADWLQLIYFSSKFLIQIILIRTPIKINCINHSCIIHIFSARHHPFTVNSKYLICNNFSGGMCLIYYWKGLSRCGESLRSEKNPPSRKKI